MHLEEEEENPCLDFSETQGDHEEAQFDPPRKKTKGKKKEEDDDMVILFCFVFKIVL
jgi:hypothetical protein